MLVPKRRKRNTGNAQTGTQGSPLLPAFYTSYSRERKYNQMQINSQMADLSKYLYNQIFHYEHFNASKLT